MTSLLALLLLLQNQSPLNDPNRPRAIAARDTVWIEEMTWLEVHDAIKAGKTTALILTGGIEQNGPYLATGKHNYILKAMGESIARKLGNAVIAPIVTLEPGNPATSRTPGTVLLSQATYRAVLTDMATSLKSQGFKNIVLMGDSGGNEQGMRQVTQTLTEQWKDDPSARIHHIAEYYGHYDDKVWNPMMERFGVKEVLEGLHDDYGTTAVMLLVDPDTVRLKERIAAGKTTINGISIVPTEKTIEIARKIIEDRANATVQAIRKSIQ
jgi:creatinine amidohydrolase/Fe(II)-dependent formamide hydrolase-like protein